MADEQEHTIPNQSQSPHLNGNEQVWSTIHEDNQPSQLIFPPINHEGIHIHLHHQHQQIDTERTSPPSPVSTPRSRPTEIGQFVAFGWWDSGLDVLRLKFVSIVSFIRTFSINRRFNFTLAGSIVVLLLMYLRSRRRRRLRKESIVELIRIIKEKDEKIHQLLYQIARMNELLLATHHGVPLISKV